MTKIFVVDEMVEARGTLAEPYREVEVAVSPGVDGYSLWVNIDGKCRLRAQGIPRSMLKMNLTGKLKVESGA